MTRKGRSMTELRHTGCAAQIVDTCWRPNCKPAEVCAGGVAVYRNEYGGHHHAETMPDWCWRRELVLRDGDRFYVTELGRAYRRGALPIVEPAGVVVAADRTAFLFEQTHGDPPADPRWDVLDVILYMGDDDG